MQTFKTFLCFIALIAIAYSCEPEELPGDSNTSANEIDADTGTQDHGDNDDETDDGHD